MSSAPQSSRHPSRNVVAVLGPTNTGKTHLAIERMLGHRDGVIGLPLRLLAREVYERIAGRLGTDAVALFTGEEKIAPAGARFRVCTVEAMPLEVDASFVAVDEIQLAADLERGHVFTDRILNLRGRDETLLLGAATMRGIIEKLVPGVNIVTRPRMSVLAYSGSRKITRLPARSAVVAFSSDDVYAIAELIRRQRGGAAVVLGALSPRTRNAQVEIYQSGDVDFLVATDAIGMGLNLDVDHIAFASDRKFDGYQHRRLTAAEFGQIAGRAGRHMRDGTFGVTSRVQAFDDDLVDALVSHRFEDVKTVQWRNRELDFSSLNALKSSLDIVPQGVGLSKSPPSEDVDGLLAASRIESVAELADRPERVALLWEVCQVPDYRKIAPANHNELLVALFSFLAADGVIPDDWFADQLAHADRTDGDIDTLSNRIAHIRTWTFAANRHDWLNDPGHWQERTRAIEDRLSDALHDRLTARFIDRRTSVLMRRLKENVMLEAEVTETGDVLVEGQHVGSLDGFRFAPDPSAAGPEAKALRTAAQKALAGEIVTRAEKASSAPDAEFALSADGTLRWKGTAIARLTEGEDILRPRLIVLADDALPDAARERVQTRLDLWATTHTQNLVKPLFDLRSAEALTPAARGIAFHLVENFGVIERKTIVEEIRALEQDARDGMRALGVRFGAYHIYVPALLKPAPAALVAMLWALKNGGLDGDGLQDLTHLAASGRTSVPVDPDIRSGLYYAVGYKPCGNRAVRIDILERLADHIRPLMAWRSTPESPTPPDGAIGQYGFTVTVAMTSLLGCAGDDFASVLRALGYQAKRHPAPKPPVSAADGADEVQLKVAAEAAGSSASAAAEPSKDDAEAPVANETEAAAVPVAGSEPTVPQGSPGADEVQLEDVVETAESSTSTAAEPSKENAEAPVGNETEAVAVPVAGSEPTAQQGSTGVEEASNGTEPPGDTAAAALADQAEADVVPAAISDIAATGSSTAAPVASDATEQDAATVAATGSDSLTSRAGDDAAAPGTETNGSWEDAAEPAFIEVWRPARTDRPRRPRDRGRRREPDQPGGEKAARPRTPKRKPRPDGPSDRRPEAKKSASDRGPTPRTKAKPAGRDADPNSPFAALAALKAELEAKERDG